MLDSLYICELRVHHEKEGYFIQVEFTYIQQADKRVQNIFNFVRTTFL